MRIFVVQGYVFLLVEMTVLLLFIVQVRDGEGKRIKFTTALAMDSLTPVKISKELRHLLVPEDYFLVWPVQLAPMPTISLVQTKFRCSFPRCAFASLRKDLVWAHVAEYHTLKCAECPVCPQRYTSPALMKGHVQIEKSRRKASFGEAAVGDLAFAKALSGVNKPRESLPKKSTVFVVIPSE